MILLLLVSSLSVTLASWPKNETETFSLQYIPDAVLTKYGLPARDEYKEPAELTISKEEAKAIFSALADAAKSNETVTQGDVIRLTIENLKDSDSLIEKFEFFAAHSLDMIFALNQVIRPAYDAAGQLFNIAMGHCICPSNEELKKEFKDLCKKKKSNESCIVGEKMALEAIDALLHFTSLVRNIPLAISATAADKLPKSSSIVHRDFFESATEISPEFAEFAYSAGEAWKKMMGDYIEESLISEEEPMDELDETKEANEIKLNGDTDE